jgi:hypothetical protein
MQEDAQDGLPLDGCAFVRTFIAFSDCDSRCDDVPIGMAL